MRALPVCLVCFAVLAVGSPSEAQEAGSNSAAPPATEAAAVSPATPASPTPPAEPALGADVRERLKTFAKGGAPEEAGDAAALIAFYEARADAPLWVEPSGWNARAENVVAELGKAGEWGLDPKDFDIPRLPAGSGEISRSDLAAAEMQLSLAVLKYARFARGGRIRDPARQLSSYIDRQPQYREPKAVLDEIAAASDAGAALADINPRHVQFERLRQKYLAMVRDAATREEIVTVPSGPALSPGDRHPHVALVRKRLALPAPADGDETHYDPALVEAVKSFQSEKGRRPDGIVGNATRAAFNDIERPSPEKLLANMEQWRWMPDDLGSTYIWVNVPEFMVRVVKDGAVVHEERIVAGEISKQTPVFSDEIETIYFHPRWNVPESIKVLELYPSMARGGSSIQRQGLRLMYNGREINPSSVDWSSADIRHYDVYQPPGPSNVLGVVKFTFPNKHGVYMHDTSSKHLFEEPSRTFSHGCMRIRNPLRLAELILEGEGWDRPRIDGIVASEPGEVPVQLTRKVPVHVTYFTQTVDDSGNEQLFRDVYGHEERIRLALAGRWDRIAVGPDHLAPVKFVRAPGNYEFVDPFTFFFGSYGDPAPKAQKPKKKTKSASSGSFGDLFSGF